MRSVLPIRPTGQAAFTGFAGEAVALRVTGASMPPCAPWAGGVAMAAGRRAGR